MIKRITILKIVLIALISVGFVVTVSGNQEIIHEVGADVVRGYQKAVAQGDADNQNNPGGMYENGEGVPKEYIEALELLFEWSHKEAEQGNVSAQYNLGMMYYNGEGVPEDYTKAFEWLEKAAEQGHADAQYNLGMMYYNGKGLPKDYAKAIKWLEKAAAQGNIDAQYNLGWMYYNGEGLPRDYTKAIEWLEKAAVQGDTDAQGVLKKLRIISKNTTIEKAIILVVQLFLFGFIIGRIIRHLKNNKDEPYSRFISFVITIPLGFLFWVLVTILLFNGAYPAYLVPTTGLWFALREKIIRIKTKYLLLILFVPIILFIKWYIDFFSMYHL